MAIIETSDRLLYTTLTVLNESLAEHLQFQLTGDLNIWLNCKAPMEAFRKAITRIEVRFGARSGMSRLPFNLIYGTLQKWRGFSISIALTHRLV
jgi:hypothetical protein